MRRSSPHSLQNNRAIQRDPARAFFLCLLVLAQMLLPSAVARAHVEQTPGCVALSAGGDDGKSPGHDHPQQCAHCRPEVLIQAPPVGHPTVAILPARDVEALHCEQSMWEAALQILPPPRGPPISSDDV